MVFNIIPRDGKSSEWFGEAAKYVRSNIGRYETYITDYADDVCEGETQTARRVWCSDLSAMFEMFVGTKGFGLSLSPTLGELQRALSAHFADLDDFIEICDCLKIEYELLPLLIEQHDY